MDVEGDTGSCMAPVSQGDGTDEKTIDSRAFSRSLVAEVILGMSWLLVDVFDARLLVKKKFRSGHILPTVSRETARRQRLQLELASKSGRARPSDGE